MAGSQEPDWRVAADYDYLDAMTPQQLAFEFLRRNPDYQASWRELALQHGDADGPVETPPAFQDRWGLRFRG
jgi:hypothetical protein